MLPDIIDKPLGGVILKESVGGGSFSSGMGQFYTSYLRQYVGAS